MKRQEKNSMKIKMHEPQTKNPQTKTLKALILVDLQNDFMPWGSVPIEGSDEVIPLANRLMDQFELIVASQDWHPANHKCFAANHPWRMPGQVIEINGNAQLLWTMHCVQESFGAELGIELDIDKISKIFKKGTNIEMDSYSAFFENDPKKSNGLDEYLKQEKVDEIFIIGLMTDFGVKQTAEDAVKLGFKTNVIIDGCRWYDYSKENIEKSISEMKNEGVKIIHSSHLK